MDLVALFSTIAIFIGLSSGIPQITTMLKSRSASGQSATGWSLAVGAQILMGYVNFVGYQATMLAIGNAVTFCICISAVVLIRRFGGGSAAAPAVAAPSGMPIVALHDLPTGEFLALRDDFEHEARRRSIDRDTTFTAEPAFAV